MLTLLLDLLTFTSTSSLPITSHYECLFSKFRNFARKCHLWTPLLSATMAFNAVRNLKHVAIKKKCIVICLTTYSHQYNLCVQKLAIVTPKLMMPGLAGPFVAISTKIGNLTNKTTINKAKNLQATSYYPYCNCPYCFF